MQTLAEFAGGWPGFGECVGTAASAVPTKRSEEPATSPAVDPKRILIAMRLTRLRIVLCTFLLALLSLPALQAQTAPPPAPKTVPIIDGGIGSCSADITVTDNTTAPIYAANVKVHIAYGFMYLRKLDLEVGTNADGKARFTGLPDRTKQGLFFRASEGDRQGSAFVDPAKTCKADLTIVLEKKTQ